VKWCHTFGSKRNGVREARFVDSETLVAAGVRAGVFSPSLHLMFKVTSFDLTQGVRSCILRRESK
jgi:hypothetical protein